MESWRKYVAEFIGTFALVLIGCGSAVIAGQYIGFLGISLAFGLTLLVMVYAIGSISGCHINPAVTIAMLVAGKINVKDSVAYIIVQCCGAIFGAGILYFIATGNADYSIAANGLGQNFYDMNYTLIACLLAEIVLTAVFIFVIFGAISKDAPKGFAGIPIGFALVLVHIIGIPITGTSVNPARSLGPALFVGGEAINQLWLFLAAPIIGGIIAAILWKYVFENK